MKSNLIDDLAANHVPEILRASDPLFDDMLRYMEWASEGFAHCLAIDCDEIATIERASQAAAGIVSLLSRWGNNVAQPRTPASHSLVGPCGWLSAMAA